MVVEKLGDHDQAVQGAAAQCAASMAAAVGAGPVVQGMAAGMLHLNPTIREATITTMVNVR